eukprot:Skav210061  [mRNA]  locus=scaffold485:61628:63774:+ [translate_table: standard]
MLAARAQDRARPPQPVHQAILVVLQQLQPLQPLPRVQRLQQARLQEIVPPQHRVRVVLPHLLHLPQALAAPPSRPALRQRH